MKHILFALLLAATASASAFAQSGAEPPLGGDTPFDFGDPSTEPPLDFGNPGTEPPIDLGEPPAKGDRRPDAAGSAEADTEAERRRARLDTMFDRLAEAETERRAERIARNIVRRMTESGSDTVDLLMNRAFVAMQAKSYALALDYLDGVVRLKPDFAEGWNRRATVHFLSGDYGRSLVDIETTLRLEPRHFGALAGLAMILVQVEKKEQALEVMNRALEIHPFLGEIREQREKLMQELDGARI
jgi:tetratricopeptide (TPR) repeat protein